MPILGFDQAEEGRRGYGLHPRCRAKLRPHGVKMKVDRSPRYAQGTRNIRGGMSSRAKAQNFDLSLRQLRRIGRGLGGFAM